MRKKGISLGEMLLKLQGGVAAFQIGQFMISRDWRFAFRHCVTEESFVVDDYCGGVRCSRDCEHKGGEIGEDDADIRRTGGGEMHDPGSLNMVEGVFWVRRGLFD